jgi:hypothetical protein
MEGLKQLTCKICNDGKKMKRLGFHLRKMHNLNMKEYTAWNGEPTRTRSLSWFKRIWKRFTKRAATCKKPDKIETIEKSLLQVDQSIKHD